MLHFRYCFSPFHHHMILDQLFLISLQCPPKDARKTHLISTYKNNCYSYLVTVLRNCLHLLSLFISLEVYLWFTQQYLCDQCHPYLAEHHTLGNLGNLVLYVSHVDFHSYTNNKVLVGKIWYGTNSFFFSTCFYKHLYYQ